MKKLGAVWLILATTVSAAPPELPRNSVDTYYVPGACTTTVSSGGNVQTAINNASCGHTVCLEAGATFTGNFTLPDKDCTDSTYVVIRTATADGNFPKPGTRVAPADASLMAKLTTGSGSVITSNSDADHYRFIGIEITPSAFLTNVVELSSGEGTANQPNHIIFDRCYLHGHTTLGSRRGIMANGAYIAVVDSYLSDFKEVGADSQAFAAWNGSGPFKLENSYFEGAGENVIFGGADSTSADYIPSDITITRSHFYKPVTWKADDPSYGGTAWAVKNLFELKSARRVLIENNLFEQVWPAGQSGYAVLFTVRNQGNTAPWSTIEDVTFRDNWIRRADTGFNVLGKDDLYTSQTMTRVEISNNLISELGGAWCAGNCQYEGLGTIIAPSVDFVWKHNSSFPPRRIIYFVTGTGSHTGFIYDYEVALQSDYGFICDSGGLFGKACLDARAPSWTVAENVFIGSSFTCSGSGNNFPTGNYCPTTTGDVGFENYAGADYRLDIASSYFGIAPNGADLGAWIPSTGIQTMTAEVMQAGTSAVIRFGKLGLPATASCTVRYGASSTTSTSGGSRRTVALSGLTPGSDYFVGIDCGSEGGARSHTDITAWTPSGGNRTVPISLKPAAILTTAARVTVDYGTTTAVADGSVQNTSCSSGCTVNLTIPAGLRYWRARWQTSGDAVIATSSPQPIAVE